MCKEILAEDFVNASNEYAAFCNALHDLFEDDPIMTCLISKLNELSGDYYRSIIQIYDAGMTLDEAIRLNCGVEKNAKF